MASTVFDQIINAPTVPLVTRRLVTVLTTGLALIAVISWLPKSFAQDSKLEARNEIQTRNEPDQQKPLQSESGSSPAADASNPANVPHELMFVIAKHVNLHKGRIVTWDEIEQIMDDAAATHRQIYPIFKTTNGGLPRENEFRDRRHAIYKKFYDAKKMEGMSLGTMTPRASRRYDRIQHAADLLPGVSTKLVGTVIGDDDKPLEGVEVFLLPSDDIISVYLQDGRNRDALQEHLVRTDKTGRFLIYPEADEVFIAAADPKGFFISTLQNLKADDNIMKLQPWARIHGSRPAEGEDAKQAVHFSCRPIVNVSFNIYETRIGEDGTFDQRFLPPGKIYVQRSLDTGQGMSFSFPVSEWILIPGESEEVIIGPIPESQKKKVGDAKKNKP